MAERGGQPGNQNAKKARIFCDAIRRALAKKANGDLSAGVDKLADKLVEEGLKGEQWAVQEIGNRLDGKPAQVIVGGDDDDNPVRIEAIAIKLVQPKADGT